MFVIRGVMYERSVPSFARSGCPSLHFENNDFICWYVGSGGVVEMRMNDVLISFLAGAVAAWAPVAEAWVVKCERCVCESR